MAKKTTKELGEKEIKKLVKEEISLSLEGIVKEQKVQGEDIREIKEALLGGENKYKKSEGLSEMIQYSYNWAKTNSESGIIEESAPAIKQFYEWKENGNWDNLEKIISDHLFNGRMKAFFNLGSWAGIVALVTSIGSIISFIVYLAKAGVFK